MKIRVTLEEPDDVVDDWAEFREVFEQAAEDLGLTLTEIVNARTV